MRTTVIRPRVFPSLAWGLGAAIGRKRLVAALWAWHLLVALAITLPVYAWLNAASSLSPASTTLLDRFSVDLFAELLHYGNAGALQSARAAAIGGVLLAVLAAPLLLGTVVASVSNPGLRLADAVGRAVRAYWPFLRLFLLGRFTMLVLVGLVAGAMTPLVRAAGEGPSELRWLATFAVQVLLMALAACLGLAVTDYGLLHEARLGSRRAFRCWLAGIGYVVRRPVSSVGLWVTTGVLLGAAAAMYLAFRAWVPSNIVILILLMAVAQQAFVLTRILLRVALVAAEERALDQAQPLPSHEIAPPPQAGPAAEPSATPAAAVASLAGAAETAPPPVSDAG